MWGLGLGFRSRRYSRLACSPGSFAARIAGTPLSPPFKSLSRVRNAPPARFYLFYPHHK